MNPSTEVRNAVLSLYESMGTGDVCAKEIIIRETFLFRQEDGDWKLVQFHASVPVPNAELAG